MHHAKDNIQGGGDSFYDKVKHTGENIVERAKDAVYSGPSMTEEAKRAACSTAQKARDVACDGVDMRNYNTDSSFRYARETARDARDAVRDTARDARETVRDTAQDASDKASGIFENAKQKGRLQRARFT